MRMFSPSPRVEEEEEQEEDEFSLTQEQTEGSTQQDESSLTHGQAGGSVQQNNSSPRQNGQAGGSNNSSPRQNGAGGRLEQDGPLWERVGQQAADVAAAWSQKRRNSGSTVDQQVQENRRRIIPGSASIGSRSSIDTAAASVIENDESRAVREGKYETPSPNSRTKLNFNDDVLDLLKEQQQKNDVQAQQMQALYERLLAQEPETPTPNVGKTMT